MTPPSVRARALRFVTRTALAPVFNPVLPLLTQRSAIASAARIFPRGEGVKDVEHFLGGVLARRLIPPGAPVGKAVLYLHGGGYILGSASTYTAMASHLAKTAGCEVFVIDYRLAPEHPAPCALEDALVAWRALSQSHQTLSIAGDSAGGGLSVAAAVAARDAGLKMPSAIALISPWVDLSLSGNSMQDESIQDPLLSRKWLDWAADMYVGQQSRTAPDVSPIFADLSGLPPVLIHTGGDEILLSDTHRLEAALQAVGVGATVRIYESLWHDFQLQAGLMPEADMSLAALGGFLKTAMSGSRD